MSSEQVKKHLLGQYDLLYGLVMEMEARGENQIIDKVADFFRLVPNDVLEFECRYYLDQPCPVQIVDAFCDRGVRIRGGHQISHLIEKGASPVVFACQEDRAKAMSRWKTTKLFPPAFSVTVLQRLVLSYLLESKQEHHCGFNARHPDPDQRKCGNSHWTRCNLGLDYNHPNRSVCIDRTVWGRFDSLR